MGFKKLDTTLNEDAGRQMGELNRMLGELYAGPGAPGTSYATFKVATADATDEATAVALVNALKAAHNNLCDALSS